MIMKPDEIKQIIKPGQLKSENMLDSGIEL